MMERKNRFQSNKLQAAAELPETPYDDTVPGECAQKAGMESPATPRH